MRRTLWTVLGLVGLILGASTLPAQAVWPTAIDIAVGPATGLGGTYPERSGQAWSFTITGRHNSASTIGFAFGYAGFGADTSCVVAAPDLGTCTNHFPSTYHASLLFGTSHRRGITSFRALVGPGLFLGDEPNGLGLHGQADAAVGKSHVQLMVGYRMSVMIRINENTLSLGAGMFGLRIQ